MAVQNSVRETNCKDSNQYKESSSQPVPQKDHGRTTDTDCRSDFCSIQELRIQRRGGSSKQSGLSMGGVMDTDPETYIGELMTRAKAAQK
ncbi:MAG: hypothetical protein B6D68_02290 [spirochete symbiont of Stewartia floridana]|nr:MAG: hypothetical protein B6D68_02290 [spirochete symbiont of Stewartia floridana]